jgi:hypothetical protein
MKITRKQLKKILMREFRDTGSYRNFDFGAGSGGSQIPPVEPPRRGGGGDGEGSGGFNGRNNNPCGFGSPKGDYYYDLVFNTFGTWMSSNMKSDPSENEYDNYLNYLRSIYPEFTMDMISEDYMEFFELLMTAIAEYACANNIEDVESIYRNPIPAILDF